MISKGEFDSATTCHVIDEEGQLLPPPALLREGAAQLGPSTVAVHERRSAIVQNQHGSKPSQPSAPIALCFPFRTCTILSTEPTCRARPRHLVTPATHRIHVP